MKTWPIAFRKILPVARTFLSVSLFLSHTHMCAHTPVLLMERENWSDDTKCHPTTQGVPVPEPMAG